MWVRLEIGAEIRRAAEGRRLDEVFTERVLLAPVAIEQRSQLTTGQRRILTALDLPEPPKFADFTLTG